MITKVSKHGDSSHLLAVPGIRESAAITSTIEPVQPILFFACHHRRRRQARSFYRYLKTLRDPEEAARKWLAFSNLPR